jgi:hypothetical protein
LGHLEERKGEEGKMFSLFGRGLIILGIILTTLGVVLWLGEKTALFRFFQKFPGQIYFKKGNFTFYFPFGWCLLISLLLTLLLNLFFRRK